MRDKDLYGTILGITKPWHVADVELSAAAEEVRVVVEYSGDELNCPKCGEKCPRYDTRRREWRHLDTCQYRTILVADVPRIKCKHDGVLQIKLPWAETGSRFTALFECLAIDWLKEASLAAVARRLGLSWDEVDGIMQRAVRRGLARRKVEAVTEIGVDETAFQRRHEFVTVVSDLKRSRVLYVSDGRGRESLEGFFAGLNEQQRAALSVVSMDMWRPYIDVTREQVPQADRKIAFDRFHIAQQINNAVNEVRKQEHRALRAEGDDRLVKTRFLWLMGPERRKHLDAERRNQFDELRNSTMKVARAWAMKELARNLWHYTTRGWAERAWNKWIGWAMRSQLEPMKRVGRMLRSHLWGVLNAVVLKSTNAVAESLNARIQKVKSRACGFRNRERFRNAIYFHCGGLDLYPLISSPTHSKA